MTNTLPNATHLASIQPEHLPPPSPADALTRGEDRDAYDHLRRRLVAQLRPGDVIQEVLVGDVCDLVWEAARLRRIRARWLEASEHHGVREILEPQMSLGDGGLVEGWAQRAGPDVARVEERIAAAGFGPEHVAACTFVAQMDDMERLDRMIAATETRRAAALREIERHRAALARDMRAGADVRDDVGEVLDEVLDEVLGDDSGDVLGERANDERRDGATPAFDVAPQAFGTNWGGLA